MTAVTATQQSNPPLPLRKDAILNHLAHHATNGPAYVQLGATKALARLTGLYAEARYEAQLAFETARDAVREAARQGANQATEKALTGYERITELMNGAEVTKEDLGDYASMLSTDDEQEAADDEDGSTHAEDEPP